MYALNCCHWYCEDCWSGFLGSAIGSKQTRIQCPEPGCSMIATSDMYSFFCSESIVKESLVALIKAFIEDEMGG